MPISRALWYIVVAILVIAAIQLVVWHGGEILYALVVIALIIIIYNLVTGRRRV